MRSAKTWALVFVLLLIANSQSLFTAQLQTAKPVVGLDQVLLKVRQAVNYEAVKTNHAGVVLTGEVTNAGLNGRFNFSYTPDGKFHEKIEAQFPLINAFDGATGWSVDKTGMPQTLELGDLEDAQTEAWVRTHRWLADDSPFETQIAPEQTNDKQVALSLKLKDGTTEGRVIVDRATWTPKSLVYGPADKIRKWEFFDYRKTQIGVFAHRQINSYQGLVTTFNVLLVTRADGKSNLYAPITKRPDDTRWKDGPAQVEIRRARTGHLLVRPKINGRDAGWFLFDTGAGAMIVSVSKATELGLPAFGKIPVGGVGGTASSAFREVASFELGPMTINKAIFVELDLNSIGRSLGENITGICGYDLLSRAVVILDAGKNLLELHNPDRFQLNGAEWQDVFIVTNHPHVKCRFEGDREGIFVIDTGAGWNVGFHTSAVEQFKLLEGRETRSVSSSGIGGSAQLQGGQIEWFEFAGERFEKLEVMFSQAKEGALVNPRICGNVGAGLLRQFQIVFNYPQRKIAFIKNNQYRER